MQPIVQKEFYLAKAAGLYDGEVPNPVTTTDYYYAALCGKYVGELPEPVTAEQKYLANLLGEDVAVPKPITLDDIFMYDAVMRIVAEEPVTRQQYYWRLIAKSRQYINKTASGNPITLTDSEENKPLNMKLYGWSKQDGEPTPDNPVEIESAGMKWSTGKNLFHVTKESDCNKANPTTTQRIILPGEYACGLTFTNLYAKCLDNVSISDRKISYSVTGIGYGVGVGVSVENGKKYAVSAKMKNGDIYAVFYDESGTLISYTNIASRYFEAPDDTQYTVLLFRKSVVTSANEEIVFEDIQIEESSSSTTYEPYTGGVPKPYGDKVGVSVRGKNLFHITKESDCDKAYDNTTKRIILPGEYLMGLSPSNYHIAYDVSIDLNTDSISFIYSGNSGYGVGIGTNCQKNKTYAFSFETNKGAAYAVFYGEDGACKARVLVSTYNVFFVPDYVEHVVIVLTNNNGAVAGDTIWFKNVQIEEAKSITAYEPYRTPQSTAIVTPNGLPGIPVPSNTAGITYTDANGQEWIADEIDLERGKYVQRVWQAEFDGSKDEAWAVSGTTFYSPSLPTNMKFRDGVTNKYAVRNVQNIQCVNFGRGNTALCVANPSEYDGSLDDKGLSNFKAHLAANPLVVMTYLDTPIERDLTSAELAEYTQLYGYKPTTVVENNSGCWMDVTALCKPK